MHQNQTQWELPNPFIKPDGTMVRTVEEWPQQQAYLKQILAEDLYGVMPPAPGNVTAEKKYEQSLWDGTGIFESYELSFGPDSKVHMRTVLIRQAEITAPQIPIILCGGYVAEPIARMVVEQGRVLAIPFCDDAAPDEPGYRSGSLYQAYPDYSFKVIAMWGWLMSRVADWLETLPSMSISASSWSVGIPALAKQPWLVQSLMSECRSVPRVDPAAAVSAVCVWVAAVMAKVMAPWRPLAA